MKKILFSLLALFSFLNVSAQETVIWDGTPANPLDKRASQNANPNATYYDGLNLQEGDVLRIFLSDITESQKVWLKIEGGSVNSPDVMDEGTQYFDYTLTQTDIDKMINKGGQYTNYKGGFYVKFEKSSGKVYRVTLRRKNTPKNHFALCLDNTTAGTLALTADNKLRLVQTADIAQNDTVVVKYSISDYNSATTYKIWTKNSSWGGSDGLPDVLSPNADGVGEMRIALPQDKAEGLHNGMILQTSTTTITIKDVLIHKYVKPEDEVLPPSTEILIWSGNYVSDANFDLRYNNDVKQALVNANLSVNDTIKVYILGANEGDQVAMKEANTWDGIYKYVTAEQKNIVEFPMTAVYAANVLSNGIVMYRTAGNTYAVRNITVAKYVEPVIPRNEVLYSGDPVYIDWSSSTYTVDKNLWKNMHVGDVLHLYTHRMESPAATPKVAIWYTGWKEVTLDINTSFVENSHYTIDITQDILDRFNSGNIIVSGYYYYMDKLVLEHPHVTVNEIIEERATPANSYGTICLPYNAASEGVVLMTMAGRTPEATGIAFDFVGGSEEDATNATLEAGVPYLYRATADAQKFTCVMTSTKVETPQSVNGFVGTFEDTTIDAGKYFLYTADDKFHPAAQAGTIGAYKCYLNTTNINNIPVANSETSARACIFGVFGNETTGIEGLNGSNGSNGSKFLQNGMIVVVKNGKKFNVNGQEVK